jgi:hypothetical protein
MRKLAVLVLLLSVTPLFAQAPLSLTRYTLSGAGIDYPADWKLSAIDGKGIMAVCFAPELSVEDPFSMNIPGLVEKGQPFTLFAIVTPEMAKELGFSTDDLDALITDAVDRRCEGGQTSDLMDTSIGWLPGRLKTGTWGTEQISNMQMAAARTLDGSAVLFVSISGGAQRDVQREASDRMRQSISIGSALPLAGAAGYRRLQNQGLSVDYPQDWHPLWVEMPQLKMALFAPVELELTALQDNFASTETVIMVFALSGEAAAEFSGNLAGALEGMLGSLGSDAQVTQRGPASIAGLSGARVSGTLTKQNGGKSSAYLAGALDANGRAVVFLGLSPVKGSAKLQGQLTSMMGSLLLR